MALPKNKPQTAQFGSKAIQDELEQEFSQTQRELSEIDLLLDQSKGEVDKLTQRNATINAHLQQIQTQIDEVPAPDIRVAYEAALEAQQRLVVMRSQLEKLHSDKTHLEHQLEILKKIRESASGGTPKQENGRSPQASIEIMIQAQEQERQRLSRQMHDGPAQALSNFILQTEIALRLFEVDKEQARQELNSLKTAASSTFQKVRDFIFDLRPMMLDDLGLVPTIKRYADYLAEKLGVEVVVSVTGSERRLQPYLEVVVFRAIQELLSNGALHTQASNMKVQLDISEHQVRASIEDNGRGFDPHSIPQEA
ncbi:MAG TPA: histidine kinase, partial [Terriglobales bacterium]|nr:histidine kinase [Terriglobales bacterium]